MKFLALCLLFFLGVMASFLWRRTLTKYQLIFAKEHFIEFAEQLADLKNKLLQSDRRNSEDGNESTNQKDNERANQSDEKTGSQLDNQSAGPEGAEPDYFITSAGLAFLYSVRSEGEEQVHHLSLSYFGQPLAYAAATVFLAFTARLLRVAPERLAVSRSRQGIYHASFRLGAAEHAELLNRQIEIPAADRIKSIQAECNQVRDRNWPMSRIEQIAGQALETKEGS